MPQKAYALKGIFYGKMRAFPGAVKGRGTGRSLFIAGRGLATPDVLSRIARIN
jgi:hypothetical protein